MANLLDKILSPLTRAESLQTWPPPEVADRWEEIQGYRRRFTNKKSDLLPYAPRFSKTAYGKEIFTPLAVAREVCNFSAEMLFSAPPKITLESNQDLLDTVLEENRLDSRLIALAAVIAAEGSGGLRIIMDTDDATPEVPLITRVKEDEVIWDIRHGDWVAGGAVVIEREVKENNGINTAIYRLVEEHTPGKVTRRLFKGTTYQLGKTQSLTTLDEFSGLPEEESTGLDVPTLVRWENVPGAYSDLAGAEAMLDLINTEVSLGAEKSDKSRPVSFAPANMFDDKGRVDLAGIIPVRQSRMRDLEGEDLAKNFGTIQPAFLADEATAWIDFLIDTSLLTMGYSKASYGRDEGGSADSGKALRLRQARTLLKKAGKDRMAKEALSNAIAIALAWEQNATDIADFRPEIELGDGLPRDAMEDAQEAVQWKTAGAISLEELVRMRRPDFDDDAVQEEIDRIQEDTAASAALAPMPTFGGPAEEPTDNGSGLPSTSGGPTER